MARVQRVAKCRKDQGTCGKCGVALPRGSRYIWWAFKFGGKYKRCVGTDCQPRRSELTQSEILGTLYDMQDSVEPEGKTPEDLADSVQEFSEGIRTDLVDLIQEKLDAIEEGMGHAYAPVYEELEDRREAFEAWAEEIESAADEIRDMEMCECDNVGECDCKEWTEGQFETAVDTAQNAIGASPE